MTTSDPLLSVTDLRKSFPLRSGLLGRSTREVRAVDGVSFDMWAGTTMALVGESGCGKSTVAKLLLSLIRADSGSALLSGQEILSTKTGDRRLQIVSQNPWSALNRRKSIRHALTQPLLIHGLAADRSAAEDRAAELLEQVGLGSAYLTRRPEDLSGGELQRVTLARAIAVEPQVLVLDEATASLDVSVKATLVNLLIDLQERLGLTYLLITHEIDIARLIAHDVCVMYLGSVVERGPAEQVFYDPQHPYTAGLLASVPLADPRQRSRFAPISGEVPSALNPPSGCTFRTRCRFSTDECAEVVPPMQSVGAGHGAACIRLDAVRAAGSTGASSQDR